MTILARISPWPNSITWLITSSWDIWNSASSLSALTSELLSKSQRISGIDSWHILSNPMRDLSSCVVCPNFSFLVSASSFSAISSTLRFNSFVNRCRLVGIFQKIGIPWASNMKLIAQESSLMFPKASKTCETGGRLPSRHPKLCENPAIPILSSLLRHMSPSQELPFPCSARQATSKMKTDSRNVVHPNRLISDCRYLILDKKCPYHIWTSVTMVSTWLWNILSQASLTCQTVRWAT